MIDSDLKKTFKELEHYSAIPNKRVYTAIYFGIFKNIFINRPICIKLTVSKLPEFSIFKKPNFFES